MSCKELWLEFGTVKNYRLIPAHEIAKSIGPERAAALPAFHAFTGCDTTSSFLGRGKKTAWQAWEQFPEVTSVFKRLSNPDVGVAVVENEMAILEEFTVSLYSKKLETKCVNEARELLFSQGKRSIENLPPTKNALVQHALRSAYQAGIIWGQSLNPLPDLPSPSLFGWEKETEESGWNPTWTDLPEASKVCRELIKCSCKKKCGGRCKCTKLQLKCSKLCSCSCK